LQQLDDDWTVDLTDAVAAYRTDDGQLRIDQSLNLTTKEEAALGGALGMLLGGLIAAPFTAGISAAAAVASVVGAGAVGGGTLGAVAGADDAATFKEQYGVTDEFVQQVGGLIQPGNSAVFAVIHASDPEAVAEHFRGYGGTILKTTLPPIKAAVVQDTIRSR
jgi:uncharacterized membrane protein